MIQFVKKILYRLSSPILCLAYNGEQLASGCYGRSVSIFDTRVNDGPVLKHISHKKAVICIVADDKYVISGSEDKSVIVYDKVAAKILQKLEVRFFMCFIIHFVTLQIVHFVNGQGAHKCFKKFN